MMVKLITRMMVKVIVMTLWELFAVITITLMIMIIMTTTIVMVIMILII